MNHPLGLPDLVVASKTAPTAGPPDESWVYWKRTRYGTSFPCQLWGRNTVIYTWWLLAWLVTKWRVFHQCKSFLPSVPSSTLSSKTVIWLTHSSPRTSLIYCDCHYSRHGQFFATNVTWPGMEWRRNVHNQLCWASTSSKKSITAPRHHGIPAIGYHCPTASLPHDMTSVWTELNQGLGQAVIPWCHGMGQWCCGVVVPCGYWYYTPCLGQRRCICLKGLSFLLVCCFLGFIFWGQSLLINATFAIELNIKEHKILLFHGARWNAELISPSA